MGREYMAHNMFTCDRDKLHNLFFFLVIHFGYIVFVSSSL